MEKVKSFQLIYTIMVTQKKLHYKIYHTTDENNLLQNILSNEFVVSADVMSTINIGGNQMKIIDDKMQRSSVRIELENNDDFKHLDVFLRKQYDHIWFDH
jgi:hypothetical protein